MLCHTRGQILLAEERVVKAIAAVAKPAQRTTYRDLARARHKLKENFLSAIGHNLVESTMAGRVNDYEESLAPGLNGDDEDHNVSNWVAKNNVTILEAFDNPDSYPQRKIGVKEPKAWKNKKCSSCKIGFNSKSDPLKCDGCDSFTHKKLACIKEGSNNTQFYCKLCIPENLIGKNAENIQIVNPTQTSSRLIKVLSVVSVK